MGRAGVSWIRRTRRRAAFTALAIVAALPLSSVVNRAEGANAATRKVIVRLAPGASTNPADYLLPINGILDRTLPSINGFSAWISSDSAAALEATAGVLEVSNDGALSAPTPEPDTSGVHGRDVSGFVQSDFGRRGGGSSFARLDVDAVSAVIGADDVRRTGITGAGIDIAL